MKQASAKTLQELQRKILEQRTTAHIVAPKLGRQSTDVTIIDLGTEVTFHRLGENKNE